MLRTEASHYLLFIDFQSPVPAFALSISIPVEGKAPGN